jgi:predicted RNA-binding protein with PUA-like domain
MASAARGHPRRPSGANPRRNPPTSASPTEVKKGDPILYYHTGKEKAVVGTARAATGAYLDPKKKDGKTVVVEVAPVKRLPKPVPLAAIKARPSLKGFPLVRISRLSVMPVSDAEWKEIEELSRG